MPRTVSYTPPWLLRPSPGSQVFEPIKKPAQTAHGGAAGTGGERDGPKRIIARRGTEVFVVVGNEIRWTDLLALKDDWEEARSQGEGAQDRKPSYRVRALIVV